MHGSVYTRKPPHAHHVRMRREQNQLSSALSLPMDGPIQPSMSLVPANLGVGGILSLCARTHLFFITPFLDHAFLGLARPRETSLFLLCRRRKHCLAWLLQLRGGLSLNRTNNQKGIQQNLVLFSLSLSIYIRRCRVCGCYKRRS